MTIVLPDGAPLPGAPSIAPPPVATALLMALRSCLCDLLKATTLGPACRCYLAWGSGFPIQDGCSCVCEGPLPDGVEHNGDAWVKLDGLDPDGGIDDRGWCAPAWLATITLGVYRCTPVPEEDEVPDADEVTDTSLALASDMTALFQVRACCTALDEGARVLTWSPFDITGGCGGSYLTLQVPLAGTSTGCPV